jgi:CheY-like chemotaxis protein/HPt (histidine-containing phosphotransfer) domain-containing protein
MLKQHGIIAELVSSGKDAISALSRNHYDLIFMDLQMPEMDGFEATSRIRSEELSKGTNNRIPIIALTAYAIKDDREKCLNAGMDDYLCKPVAVNELTSILEKWLKDKIRKSPGTIAGLSKSSTNHTSDSTHIIFDYKGVCDRLMNDMDLIKNVLKLYFTDTLSKIVLVKKALLEENCTDVEMFSHAIKGASANVGLEGIRYIAAVIEQAGRVGDLSIARSLILELEEQFATGKVQVQKIFTDASI